MNARAQYFDSDLITNQLGLTDDRLSRAGQTERAVTIFEVSAISSSDGCHDSNRISSSQEFLSTHLLLLNHVRPLTGDLLTDYGNHTGLFSEE